MSLLIHTNPINVAQFYWIPLTPCLPRLRQAGIPLPATGERKEVMLKPLFQAMNNGVQSWVGTQLNSKESLPVHCQESIDQRSLKIP